MEQLVNFIIRPPRAEYSTKHDLLDQEFMLKGKWYQWKDIEGDKNMIKFEGDHNSPRPQFYFDSISIFFKNVLQPPEDDVPVSFFDPMHEYIDKATWNALHGLGYAGSNSSDPASSTSGDAIEQLRSKGQMSRMEAPPNMAARDSQPEAKVQNSFYSFH